MKTSLITDAYTWSWSEATILTSQWGVEISYKISLNLTFFICKWRHQYVLCGVFVVLKWNMSNMSKIQCLETGTLSPFFLYTYHSSIGSFLIFIELCQGVVCEVKLRIKAEQRACMKIYYLILWDGLFGYFRTREKSLLYASYKWDNMLYSWFINLFHSSQRWFEGFSRAQEMATFSGRASGVWTAFVFGPHRENYRKK